MKLKEMGRTELNISNRISKSIDYSKLAEPENFYIPYVKIYNDEYDRKICKVTLLFKNPFNGNDTDELYLQLKRIKKKIQQLLPNLFYNISISSSSTIDNYITHYQSLETNKY